MEWRKKLLDNRPLMMMIIITIALLLIAGGVLVIIYGQHWMQSVPLFFIGIPILFFGMSYESGALSMGD